MLKVSNGFIEHKNIKMYRLQKYKGTQYKDEGKLQQPTERVKLTRTTYSTMALARKYLYTY